MPGFRTLFRIAPVVVGVVAVSLWLRRRAPKAPKAEPPRRFQRGPIDIVTVVDDLLRAGR